MFGHAGTTRWQYNCCIKSWHMVSSCYGTLFNYLSMCSVLMLYVFNMSPKYMYYKHFSVCSHLIRNGMFLLIHISRSLRHFSHFVSSPICRRYCLAALECHITDIYFIMVILGPLRVLTESTTGQPAIVPQANIVMPTA